MILLVNISQQIFTNQSRDFTKFVNLQQIIIIGREVAILYQKVMFLPELILYDKNELKS